MTAKQAITIEQALARAKAENIHIIMRGRDRIHDQRLWVVSAKGYETTNKAYVVRQVEDHLDCNCRAQSICKHRAVVHAELKAMAEQLAEAERLAQLPRSLANVEVSEETKLLRETGKIVAQTLSVRPIVATPAAKCFVDDCLEPAIYHEDGLDCCRFHRADVSPADEPQPDIVALLAEPDLPRSALYFEDDEPKQSFQTHYPTTTCKRCGRPTNQTNNGHCQNCDADLGSYWTEAKRAEQAERSAKREAAILATDNRAFSIWKA